MSPYLGFRKLIYDEMVEMTLLQHFMILVWKKKIIGNTFYEAFTHKWAARPCTIQNREYIEFETGLISNRN